MRILLHKSALTRIDTELSALGVPAEIITVGGDGTLRRGDHPIDAATAAPDVVWISVDALEAQQMDLFMDLAVKSRTVKWVQTFNAGLDWRRFREIFDAGIRLSNSNAQSIAIAEYVLANVLAEWHPIAQQRAAQRAHQWTRVPFRELSQSSWLIVGFGHIGREIARRAKTFGAKIAGIKRTVAPDPLADDIATLADLPRLLPQADVVVLAVALNDATRDLAGAAFFDAMKRDSILVNIGRGRLVVDAALLAALDKGTPAVAILDVFRKEPLPADSPYWDHPRVRLTAHASSAGSGTAARNDRLFLANLRRFADAQPLINEVDPQAL